MKIERIKQAKGHRVLLLGISGSGKGTMGRKMEEWGYHHLPSGRFMEEEAKINPAVMKVLKAASLELGRKAFELVKGKVAEYGFGENLVFDGFPRTYEQCGWFKEFLGETFKNLSVIYIQTPKTLAKDRCLNDPGRAGRPDNNPETFDLRHQNDPAHIEDMIAFLKDRGVIVHSLYNDGSLENTTLQLQDILLRDMVRMGLIVCDPQLQTV